MVRDHYITTDTCISLLNRSNPRKKRKLRIELIDGITKGGYMCKILLPTVKFKFLAFYMKVELISYDNQIIFYNDNVYDFRIHFLVVTT